MASQAGTQHRNLELRTEAKLEYWDESYPDHCRTLYADWMRAGARQEDGQVIWRQMARQELNRNRGLALYLRERLGAGDDAERRLIQDVIRSPEHTSSSYHSVPSGV